MEFSKLFYSIVDQNINKLPKDLKLQLDRILSGEQILSGIIIIPKNDFSRFSCILLTQSRLVLIKPINGVYKYDILYLENLEWQEYWSDDKRNYYEMIFSENRKITGKANIKYYQFHYFLKTLNLLLSSGHIKKVFKVPQKVEEKRIDGFIDRSEGSEVVDTNNK